MFTGIISAIAAIFKAIPSLVELWEKLSKKRTDAEIDAHRETKRMEDDAAVDAAIASTNGVQTPTSQHGEQQKNPHDFFPGVD